MYSPQEIADKIKQLAKNKGVSLKQMLSDCELGINFVSQIASGSAITYINLAKIADYLGVSIDYLLGRDDTTSSSGGLHNGIPNQLSKDERAFINNFIALSPIERASLIKILKKVVGS